MSKANYFSQADLKSVIDDYEEKKSRFKFVIGKLIDFEKSKSAGQASYQSELAALEQQAKEEYQQTFDDSAFDKLEQFKKENSNNSDKNMTKQIALHSAVSEAANNLSHADAVAAEAGSQAWMLVADDLLEDAEQSALINIMKVLYIRRKMNYGNYSEHAFLDKTGAKDDIGMGALKVEVERIYKDNFNQVDYIKKQAIEDLPKIPYAKVLDKKPGHIIDVLNSSYIGTAAFPWKSVTVENLIREV